MFSGFFQKVGNFFKPQPNQSREQSRLTSYIDYKVNECIINYIQIDNTRLYFKAFDKKETVQTLQEQFLKIHSKQMALENKHVKISPNMPLNEILNSAESRKAFEEIVTNIEHKKQIQVNNAPEKKKILLQKIIKKCNDFSSYECQILMKNGPRKPLQIGYKITKDTTFNTIIKQMNTCPLIVGQDIEFYSQDGKKYEEQLYSKTFQQLNIKESTLTAHYSYKNSLIRGNSLLSIHNYQGKLIPAHLLATVQKPQILSFNCKFRKIDINQIANTKQFEVIQYFRLTLSIKLEQNLQRQSSPVIFQSTGSLRVFVLTQNFEQVWLPVQKLQMHHQIGGIDPQQKTFAIYKINNIERIDLQKAQTFYGIEVLPAHQYIANSIIVHNSDSFTIKAYHINNGQKKIEQVRFYRHQKIQKYFKDKICEVGGYQLKNSHTFGDYQLEQFKIIYVYDKIEERTNKRETTFSQWKRQSVEKNQQNIQQTQEYSKMIEEEYFGIYEQRIIASKEIKQLQNSHEKKIINILVGLRMYFERINYYINKNPKYKSSQKQALVEHQHLKKSQRFVQITKKKQNKSMTIDEMFGTYLYTTNAIYGEVNKYLRQFYVKDDPSQDSKYLPIVGSVSKSTKCANPYRGVVYRGIRDIDLEKALGLDKKQQLINDNPSNKYQDKFIIFTSFTSTSKAKTAANDFLGSNTSSFLTIITNKGYFISSLSHFPSEEQVLILPFTYFIINNYNLKGPVQTAQLEEIPMPQTNLNKIIFWVDDNPEDNDDIIKGTFEPQGIEVIQVTSTRIMKVILQNFFWIFKMLGKKVVIISDMVRRQYGMFNYTAGVDLFLHIYNEYGLSNKAIIYAQDRPRALANLKQKGVIDGNWLVTNSPDELIKQVAKQFEKM